MSNLYRALRTSFVTAIALTLSGCVTLLPESKPADLYRFGADATQVADNAPPRPAPRVGVARISGAFAQAASGDKILTVTGARVAYLADARWISTASVLFDEAVLRGFDASASTVRIINRNEPALAVCILRLDVQQFEADYDHGPGGAPQVNIVVHATLLRAADRAIMRDEVFRGVVRARANRVTSIVAAFDEGVRQVITQVVAMTSESARPA